MNLLIIHCPVKPFSESTLTNGELSSLQDRFEWCLCETNSIHAQYQSSGIGSIESMPYADEVFVLMPTLDVRLIEVQVPLVKAKKVQQVLPSIVEDHVLDSIDNSLIYALPPLPGQAGSQKTVAIINRQWFYWLAKQFERVLTPRIRMIPDCLILPLATEGDTLSVPGVSSIAYKKSDETTIYTWHKTAQIGISWVEYSDTEQLPSLLQNIEPSKWSWDWMVGNVFSFSRRTDIAAAGINLFLAVPKSAKSSWKDQGLWIMPIRWAIYAVSSTFLGLGIYASWLAIDNWRWKRNMDLSAVQFLAPETATLITESKGNHSITEVFVKQATQEARNKALATDADFIAMAGKLQQLKTALGMESISNMEYDGYCIDFEFKPISNALDPIDVMKKAESLGLMVANLGKNRYRLLPYSGLGAKT